MSHKVVVSAAAAAILAERPHVNPSSSTWSLLEQMRLHLYELNAGCSLRACGESFACSMTCSPGDCYAMSVDALRADLGSVLPSSWSPPEPIITSRLTVATSHSCS